MLLKIDWEKPVIQRDVVLQIQIHDLDDFYILATDGDKSNLFFMLLTSLYHYLDDREEEKAAHLSFLIAYYLFTPLTPPGSCELALHYIKQAISLNSHPMYEEWCAIIKKGN